MPRSVFVIIGVMIVVGPPPPNCRASQRGGCSSPPAFCFFGGEAPPPVGGPQREMIPLFIVSTTLSAKSSEISLASGCPPCCRQRHLWKVHRPKTLDQHRNGRPLGWTYWGSVGRSVCFLPATFRISAKWTRPLVLSRYADIIAFSFGCRSSCQLACHARGW